MIECIGRESKKCLVLGGNGFIGGVLCQQLRAAGYSVRTYGRRVAIRGTVDIEHVVGDFENSGQLAEAVAGCTYVFHLISTTVPASSNDDPYFDVQSNIGGTVKLLELCRANKIKRIFFASSGGTVYGLPEQLPIPEGHPNFPISSYGVTKLTIERYLHLYSYLYGLEFNILRISNPYGDGQNIKRKQGVIGVFVQQIADNKAIEIWGDGSVIRDYIHVNDVARAFVTMLEADVCGEVFNIGSGKGYSLNEIVDIIKGSTAIDFEVLYKPSRAFDVPEVVLDITKAQRLLGWAPILETKETIEVLVKQNL